MQKVLIRNGLKIVIVCSSLGMCLTAQAEAIDTSDKSYQAIFSENNKADDELYQQLNSAVEKSYNTLIDGAKRFEINNKYGFVNKNNEIIIPAIYDYAEPFKQGL